MIAMKDLYLVAMVMASMALAPTVLAIGISSAKNWIFSYKKSRRRAPARAKEPTAASRELVMLTSSDYSTSSGTQGAEKALFAVLPPDMWWAAVCAACCILSFSSST